MVNAAIRMNLIGPLEGGCLTNELCSGVNELVESHLQDLINSSSSSSNGHGNELQTTATTTICSHAHQVSPLIEVLSNAHDRLYTRLFNS